MRTFLVVVAISAPCTSLRASHDSGHATPATTLLYLDRSGWERAGRDEKFALAADFMRVFCGNPAMPAANLVGCLDRSEGAGEMFERALACIATDRARQTR
jgi:hypothetical protein